MRTPAESDEFLRIIILRPCYIILLFAVFTVDILQHLILWKLSPDMDSLCTFVEEICAEVLVSLGLELMVMPPEIVLSNKSVIQILLATDYFQLDRTIHKKIPTNK